jgi:hypothetical protein
MLSMYMHNLSVYNHDKLNIWLLTKFSNWWKIVGNKFWTPVYLIENKAIFQNQEACDANVWYF